MMGGVSSAAASSAVAARRSEPDAVGPAPTPRWGRVVADVAEGFFRAFGFFRTDPPGVFTRP